MFGNTLPISTSNAPVVTVRPRSLQVINLRTLRPLDYGTVIKSVQKTNRLVTVEEGWPQNGIGADISAVVCEEAFDHLDAPIERVSERALPLLTLLS